jgi:hypothetical protein
MSLFDHKTRAVHDIRFSSFLRSTFHHLTEDTVGQFFHGGVVGVLGDHQYIPENIHLYPISFQSGNDTLDEEVWRTAFTEYYLVGFYPLDDSVNVEMDDPRWVSFVHKDCGFRAAEEVLHCVELSSSLMGKVLNPPW